MNLLESNPKDVVNTFSVEIGDWSNDGHNQSEVHTLIWDGMHPGDKIVDIFQNYLDAGASKLGFDVTEDLCSEFEDRKLPMKFMQTMYNVVMNSGLNLPMPLLYNHLGIDLEDGKVLNDGRCEDTNDFLQLVYVQACIGVNSVLPIRVVATSHLTIGGYGLFSI